MYVTNKELSISCHCSNTHRKYLLQTYLSDAMRIQIVNMLKRDMKFTYKKLSAFKQEKWIVTPAQRHYKDFVIRRKLRPSTRFHRSNTMKLWRCEWTSQAGSARGKHEGGRMGRPRVASNKEELRRTVAYISRTWKPTLVSVTLVLTQLLQYRGVEVGVMEKAKNYYVVLEHGKDGKWNLPLDERLSKERKNVQGK